MTFHQRYLLAIEDAELCEWGTFRIGGTCEGHAVYVVVDTDDIDDSEYPQGFHAAHLCEEHALPALRVLTESEAA